MARKEKTERVPNDRVNQVRKDFEDAGATVLVTDNGDGTSTIVATFPD